MRLVSIGVLALAIVLGLIAVLGVRTLINSNKAQVSAGPAAPAFSTTIVVARTPLEFGTELQPDLLKEIKWASIDRPEGSFATIAEVANGERRVALRSIAPGELVLQDRISGFGGRATLSQVIETGRRAVSLRVNDVSGAGGFVLPGDRVDVLLTIQVGDERLDTETIILLEDVRVLAIDQTSDDTQEGAVVAKAATLEVLPEDSQRIALASTIGSLSLTLRNIAPLGDDDAQLVKGDVPVSRTIRFEDLMPKKVASAAKPQSRRAVAQRTPTPKVSPYTQMRVVRGTEPSDVNVLKEAHAATKIEASKGELLGGASMPNAPPPAQ